MPLFAVLNTVNHTTIWVPQSGQRQLALTVVNAFIEVTNELKQNLDTDLLNQVKKFVSGCLEPFPVLADYAIEIEDFETEDYLENLGFILQDALSSLESKTDECFELVFADCTKDYQALLGLVKLLEEKESNSTN